MLDIKQFKDASKCKNLSIYFYFLKNMSFNVMFEVIEVSSGFQVFCRAFYTEVKRYDMDFYYLRLFFRVWNPKSMGDLNVSSMGKLWGN